LRFVFRPPLGTCPRTVALFGEASDWVNPLTMERQDDGSFTVDVALGPGAYAYKLRIDGVWTLDPSCARTRSEGGHRNGVACEGATPEPLLFAPAAPFVVEAARGGLRVHAALRKGAPGAPVVTWTEREGDALSVTTMARAAEEDEHVLFEARLPTSAARVHYAVTTDDAASAPLPFVHQRGDRHELPAWWQDAIVYAIYVDRFRPAHDRPGWERAPGRGAHAGGHLDGVRRSLPELADLGATVLYLTPVHVGASSHRYDFVDPLAVDPALGGEEAFARLVHDAHETGLRVLVDLSFAHAGRGFPPCDDVLEKGEASPFAAWFAWKEENGARVLRHYGRRRDAPLVDLTHPEVQDLVLRTVEAWARRGADGLRLDMAAEVPIPLARAIRARFRALRPEGIVLGELVPAHAWRWLGQGALDAATDFGFHAVMSDLARGAVTPKDAFARIAAGERARGDVGFASRLRFLSTHDHARFATIARASGRPGRVALGMVLLATTDAVPALLYGEEIGLHAPDTAGPEDVWADRAPMPWSPPRRDEALRSTVKALFAARRASAALARGETELLHADDRVLAYRRSDGDDVVDVFVNFGGDPVVLEATDDARPRLAPLVTAGDAAIVGDALRLGACSALVARRLREPAAQASKSARNVLARDNAMALALPVTTSLPTRLDFAVTEVCNLRCAHCITQAPERTTAGTARTLTPWVLDHLREALGFGQYFGFVHGGESLAAPIFWDVLGAIRAARGGAPYVAHLLTNGVLLTPKTTLRLAELGVSSISVSLDGATAETNDAVRLGGRFTRIVENVTAAARVRREEKLDLRLGLSFVVMQQNRGELVRLVELAAEMGLDWVKLEEAVPATSFAQRSLVTLGAPEMRARVAAAAARATELGLVFVDHTEARTIWRCRLDDDAPARAFLAADEHANRSEIHPCRVPWEVACIEPNGDVRGGDFFGPVLGNVTTRGMAALWNGPIAQAARERSRLARLCGPAGPVTCLPKVDARDRAATGPR
jgi:cyclomaltodextrinase / maltogenic alpha-amylase / neopullulanase